MSTRFIFTPESAHYPSTNFPAFLLSNQRPVLAFDAATSETAYWTFIAPQGLTGAMSVVVTYAMASATTGTVEFLAALEAISDGDLTDTDATASFDTANSGTETVPGTAGYISQVSVTLTTNDSIAAGDYVRLSLARDAGDATNDTATGDAYVLAVEFRDAA